MDASADRDWKQTVGFPINYNSDQSSGDDFDAGDVVMRHTHRQRSSGYLLADGGDGAPADLLGTTPPRARIRNKEKRRTLPTTKETIETSNMDGDVVVNRLVKNNRRNTTDNVYRAESPAQSPEPPERLKKRASLKLMRARERDHKMDLSLTGSRDARADSMPSPNPDLAVPTLVESCNRFMSLTSKLKCKSKYFEKTKECEEPEKTQEEDGQLQSRINFHDTFSMLIKMGNIDKSCRRAISIEEQVWQNELKDMIWLELQAKVAGRSLARQDAFLCSRRDIVPAVVQNISDYRFVNSETCRSLSKSLCFEEGSDEALADPSGKEVNNSDEETSQILGCLSFNCPPCTSNIGKALKEVGTLLDSFYNAEALYPSSKAMAAHHPLIATQLFNNRLKAMCLWYNVALHMRMRILAVRRLILAIQRKVELRDRRYRHTPSTDSDASRCHDNPQRPCTVRFNVSQNPSASNSSEASSNTEPSKECSDAEEAFKEGPEEEGGDVGEDPEPRDEVDSYNQDNYDRNGTADSTESGYLSDRPARAGGSALADARPHDVFATVPLHDVVKLRLLGKCEVSPYREYHHEVLKTQGVRRSMMFINKMRKKILKKVYVTFERDNQYSESEPDPAEDRDDEDPAKYENAKELYELRRYGCWSTESLQMRLPSYRSHFLLLNVLCMETVYDYLSLRLDTQPANPSCLTVKQLIHELKEGIDIATEMRTAYVRNVDAALDGYAARCGARADLRAVLAAFDDTLETVVKQYLSYLRTMSAVEQLARGALEAEWAFSARLARRARRAAALAPPAFAEIMCNQLRRLLERFTEHFAELMNHENYPDDTDDADTKRQFVYTLCREAQNIYACEKETTIQTVQFSRLLASRLRKSAEFFHHRQMIFKSVMEIRECISRHTAAIVKETCNITWEEDLAEPMHARLRELLLQLYKLGFELHKEVHKFVYGAGRGAAPGGAGARGGRRRPASLQPPRRAAPPAPRRRPDTIYVNASAAPPPPPPPAPPPAPPADFHKELHRFVNESTTERSKGQGPVHLRQGPGTPAKAQRPRVMRAESIGGDNYDKTVFDDMYMYSTASTELSVPEMGDEEPPEAEARAGAGARAGAEAEAEARWCQQVSRAIVDFARCWMKFVMERCARGRGVRPRWASQGLDFLILACDPNNTKHLSEDEFEELKVLMDACISHVIGSREAAPAPEPATPPPRRHRAARAPRRPSTSSAPGGAAGSRSVPAPPSPPAEPDPLLDFNLYDDAHAQAWGARVAAAVRRVEAARDGRLRARRAVGRQLAAPAGPCYEPKLRQVTFKWQRGIKIGAGTFGKVYTVVNTESGQLLAMKELSIGAGDRRAMQRAANELQVLEGVIHPHLVCYYGCELHREEMLIFMELCVEGSLEALLAASGGLPESQVRGYCKQLVAAVCELHARKIAHRDIKSGNIFLTNDGHCLKLGDFGCAVKIRANSTAAGELQGCVGTQAYMAPEVFMKSSGHGRAADIWSLGCVVTEMASGKRPFSEYDSNYQIMFVVGMGGRPEVPESLSEEGRQFCRACLTHDPAARPRADALVMDTFLMVKSEDEDCKCEPAFFLSSNKTLT